MRWTRMRIVVLAAVASGGLLGTSAAVVHAQPSPEPSSWPILVNPFESTGGGGIMIYEYRPVVDGATCRTDFVARTPDGQIYRNEVTWTARPQDGGVLCFDGHWRAKDASASGTTPLRVFIKDGVIRRSP